MVLKKALRSALGGGIPGALAMVLQVVLLMWLRTTINFQMAKGMSTFEAMRFLYAEGGIPRFYQGMWAALLQAPLSRFGDTAANAGVLSLLEGSATVPVFVKTLLASVAAGSWRVLIMPIDAVKTTLQVQGAAGMKQLAASIRSNGIGSLYAGALGANLATFMGHYPWFYVNNLLESTIPVVVGARIKLMRRAFIGFCSSFVADCASNGMRVVKTYIQTSPTPVGYLEAAKLIVAADGIQGLLWRGLATKLVSNGIQSILFSILWKMMMDRMNTSQAPSKAKANGKSKSERKDA